MGVQAARNVNRLLSRLTGYSVHRAGRPYRPPDVYELPRRGPELPPVGPSDRLLRAPVFVLCSLRSGSTLLRAVLDSHSKIHAPPEMHLRWIGVRLYDRYSRRAMSEVGADEAELRFMLWDRILHREMARHGKEVLVNKTPSDAIMWPSIADAWPDARFIFLLREPAASARSWHRSHPDLTVDQAAAKVLPYMNSVEQARAEHDGLTVRYEQLTQDPAGETRRICDYLGLDWEPGMLDYGAHDHGGFTAGLGDWGARIKSGRIQPAADRVNPRQVPEALREISRTWGYLDAESDPPARP